MQVSFSVLSEEETRRTKLQKIHTEQLWYLCSGSGAFPNRHQSCPRITGNIAKVDSMAEGPSSDRMSISRRLSPISR